MNGQGNDWGTQYRTGIYYHDDAQKAAALASRKRVEEKIGKQIATEVMPAGKWYQAENYHQQVCGPPLRRSRRVLRALCRRRCRR